MAADCCFMLIARLRAGTTPDIHCSNAQCSRPFHRTCLVEWLQSVSNSRHSFGTIFGGFVKDCSLLVFEQQIFCLDFPLCLHVEDGPLTMMTECQIVQGSVPTAWRPSLCKYLLHPKHYYSWV